MFKLSLKKDTQVNFKNAKIIAGIHGSGFSNMKFSDSETLIFELYTEFYHDASLRVQAHALGMRYYYLIGTTLVENKIHPQKENVFINLSELKISLDNIFIENNFLLSCAKTSALSLMFFNNTD